MLLEKAISTILVVGGAGYIGSHMVKMLAHQGHRVVTLDNLCTGYRNAVTAGEFVFGDLGDRSAVRKLLERTRPDAVMHFASYIQTAESVVFPAKYYHNNLVNTINLVDSMLEADIRTVIFSSTAAIYGEPKYVPIDELHDKKPVNPYGFTKYAVERILADYDHAYGLKHVCLRYFNAAGADPRAEIGERHDPETHLIPLVLQVASGRRESITVYGQDYDTEDGTCIRDYVHVVDLCAAHLLAMEKVLRDRRSENYNLGNGNGYSVQQVIDMAKHVTGRRINVKIGDRRPGDPARLVADAAKAKAELGWGPKYAALEDIIQHAWGWEQAVMQKQQTNQVV